MFKTCLPFLNISHSGSSSVFSLYGSHRPFVNPDGIERYHLKLYLLFNLASCIS